MTDAEIITETIASEGGSRFTQNPADPGGATKYGITLGKLKDYALDHAWDHEPGVDDVRELNEIRARDIYAWMLSRSGIGKLANDDLRWIVFDAAVHMGERPAVRLLQRALKMDVIDGALGPKTLGACPSADGRKLARLVLAEQALFYGRLASKNLSDADKDGIPDQLEFLNGYMERWARKARAVA